LARNPRRDAEHLQPGRRDLMKNRWRSSRQLEFGITDSGRSPMTQQKFGPKLLNF
jgi:hypothetical protein